MQSSQSHAADATTPKPYGLLGLFVSTLVILLTAALILLLIAAAAFGIVTAKVGWQGALQRFIDLVPSTEPAQDAADHINIGVGILAYVVTAGSVLIVARFRGGAAGWTKLIGWQPWDMSRHVRLVALLLIATLVYSFVASALIEQVYPEAKDWVPTPSGTPWIIGFLALATLFAPITEELLFRGWIYTSLRRSIGARFGILVSAILFALAHWESSHLYALAVFPVGLALGFVRQRTDSVAASITFHSLYNGVASVLLFVGKSG